MPQELPDPKKKRETLYNGLKEAGYVTVSYDEFEKAYSDPAKLQSKLYTGLKEAGDVSVSYEEFESAYFGDLIKKKNPLVPESIQQQQEPAKDTQKPLIFSDQSFAEQYPDQKKPVQPAAERTPEQRVMDATKPIYESKYGKPKQSYQISPEYLESYYKDVDSSQKAISEIYSKKAQIQIDSLQKHYQGVLAKGGDPEKINAEFQSQAKKISDDLNKMMNDQGQIEYAALSQKYEKQTQARAAEKVKQKDAGFWESTAKQAYNAIANQLPSSMAAADSEGLPSLTTVSNDKGGVRFKFTEPKTWGNPMDSNRSLSNKIMDIERRIDNGEDLTKIITAVDQPDLKAALERTQKAAKPGSNPAFVKDSFAVYFTSEMNKRKQRNLDEMAEQKKESEELLADVPMTWEEAKASGNYKGYVGGALGQGAGSSLASAPFGIIGGARMMEYSEVYERGLQAKAAAKSKEWGTEITPAMLAASGEDSDVIETASLVGNINGGLETVGTFFGMGKLAKGIFAKKITQEIVKKSLGKKAWGVVSSGIQSGVAGATTEGLQSLNTIVAEKHLSGADTGEAYKNAFIGTVNKILGRKISEGQSIDDAAASFTEEDLNEITESFRQGAIAEGGMGTLGTTIQEGKALYFDRKNSRAITPEVLVEKLEAGATPEEVGIEGHETTVINDVANVTLPKLKGIAAMESTKVLNELAEQGHITRDETGKIEAVTPEGVAGVKATIERFAPYMRGLNKIYTKRIENVTQEQSQSGVVTEGTSAPVENVTPTQQNAAQPTATPVASPTTTTVQDLEKSENQEEQRIGRVLQKATKSISGIKPVSVRLYNGLQEGSAILSELKSKGKLPGNASGFYNAENGVIGIDLSKADSSTAFHEAFHPLVDAVATEKPELFESLSNEAASMPLELEDGTTTTYGEYSQGNKEESLIEFLSDFADSKFDGAKNKPTIISKVKDIVSKILKAIGLESSDVKLNLDNIKDLKSFADQLATAVSKGERITLKNKAKGKGTKFQTLGSKKKLNRTARKIAYDQQTEFKNLQADIIKNPKDYSYDPQKFADIDAYLESLSDVDLYNKIKINDDMAVLAGIKLLRRYNAAGTDTRPVFKKLREIGTGVGQLLRQFGELKNNTPEGIVKMVLDALDSQNVTLTEKDTKELEKLAKDHDTAINERENKKNEHINNPTEQTEKALDKADDELAGTFLKLNEFIAKVTPMGVDNMIATILQGNLLTAKSIVVNVLGNLVQQPLRQAELFTGDLATYMVHRFKGVPMMNPFEVYFGSTLNSIQGFGKGIPAAAVDVVKGRGAEDTSTLQVRRNLKPMQAIWQLYQHIKKGESNLPVNAKGKVPTGVLLEKALEGTAGFPAEVMFRLLYMGDKPFKDGAKIGGAYRLFAEGGGRTSEQFRTFMAELTPTQKNKIQQYADEATFSDTRFLSDNTEKFMGWLGGLTDSLSERSPAAQAAFRTIGKVFVKANFPFTRVPANLLQYLMELALPVIPAAAAIKFMREGNVRKASQLVVRATAGIAMYGMANMLYDAGVIIASGEKDPEEERQLKHEAAKPNSINMSALARYMSGTQDPNEPYQVGDDVREFTKFGLLGMFLAYNAEWNENIKRELKVSRADASIADKTAKVFGASTRTALEMSFLQGSYTALESMSKGDFSNYFAELANTLTAIAIPNQVSVATRARAPYILRADDKSFIQKFKEKQSIKLHANQEDNIAGVYPIIGLFGDPAQQNPNRGAATVASHLFQFFDVTNGEKITDPLAAEMFNIFRRTGETPIKLPTAKVQIQGKEVTLQEQDYIYLQMLAGRMKRVIIEGYKASEESQWETMKDEQKIVGIKAINDASNEAMQGYMTKRIYEGIEDGSIIFDSEHGTYEYVKPASFDYQFGSPEKVKEMLNPKEEGAN